MNYVKQFKKEVVNYLNAKLPRYPYRRYNDKNKCIFIHIPKNAGTSILDAIGAPTTGRLHIEYFHYEKADKERFNKYFKFAIVRNPLDRARSTYKYLVAGGNQDESDLYLSRKIREKSTCFSEFVINILTPSNVASFNLLRPQSAFICDTTDKTMMDSILFFESLESDWKQLKNRAQYFTGISGILRHTNKSISSSNQEKLMLSPEAFARLKLVYERDYKIFYPSHPHSYLLR